MSSSSVSGGGIHMLLIDVDVDDVHADDCGEALRLVLFELIYWRVSGMRQ
jgi:hypothetical protein